jgi:hypothetical protein
MARCLQATYTVRYRDSEGFVTCGELTRCPFISPQASFAKGKWEKPAKDAKIIPFPIERVRFEETRTVAFRLKQAA